MYSKRGNLFTVETETDLLVRIGSVLQAAQFPPLSIAKH